MTSILFSYVLTCVAIELTPGPNMAYLAVLSVERGRRAGLFAVAGVALGLALLGALAVLGVGEFVANQPLLYETLRWAGVVYLFYLAYDAWSDARRPVEELNPAELGPVAFQRGLVNNLLNPKAALFYVTVMPSFLVSEWSALGQSIALASIYVTVATGIHFLVVMLAGTLQPLLVRPGSRRAMGWVFGLLLAGVAIWVAVSTAR